MIFKYFIFSKNNGICVDMHIYIYIYTYNIYMYIHTGCKADRTMSIARHSYQRAKSQQTNKQIQLSHSPVMFSIQNLQ